SGGSVAAKSGFARAVQWRIWGRRRMLVGLMVGGAGLALAGYWLRARDPRSPQAGEGGRVMAQLPSPLDQLTPSGHCGHPDVVAQLGQAGEPKIVCLAISPDCKHVAGWRENGAIDIWEGSTGKKSYSLGEHKGSFAMAFSPDKSQLATASTDKTIKLWDLPARTHQTW